jgi:alpha-glucosidase
VFGEKTVNLFSVPPACAVLSNESHTTPARQWLRIVVRIARLFPPCGLLIGVFAAQLVGQVPEKDLGTLQSPNGLISATSSPVDQTPALAISYRSEQIVQCKLGLIFDDGAVHEKARYVAHSTSSRDETYPIAVGKCSTARDQHHELLIHLQEAEPSTRDWFVRVRAFDEGIAFRYEIPNHPKSDRYVLRNERTEFLLPEKTLIRYLPLASYSTSYEGYYQSAPIEEITANKLMALPIHLQFRPRDGSKACMIMTEANLTDYAGLYLTRPEDRPTVLVSKLSPLPTRNDGVTVTGSYPFVSPWRVLFIGPEPGPFLESNLIFHLNPPSQVTDPSWIKPGKTTFPWWNGFVLENVDFVPGLNTATQKHYIDFCAANGIPYHSLDGTDTAWYGGPIIPNAPCDITKSVPEIDLPEVLRYAKSKGVRLRAWMHWRALQAQLDSALPIYQNWGLEGIMVDFMDRDDQEMIRFYHQVAEKAARHKLTVTWHGVCKPTGMERTWPNILSYEGALNQEYNKWDAKGTPPEHNLDVAFIRGIAGPVDYHAGGMRSVQARDYQPQYKAPQVQGTRAHQLAMYVVFQNHMPMLVDFPEAYADQPGLKFLAEVPTIWDETRVVAAQMFSHLVVARRRNQVWYLGAMGAGGRQTLTVPLAWLGKGHFQARLFEDDENGPPTALRILTRDVSAADGLEIKLAEGGGLAAILTPRRDAPK